MNAAVTETWADIARPVIDWHGAGRSDGDQSGANRAGANQADADQPYTNQPGTISCTPQSGAGRRHARRNRPNRVRHRLSGQQSSSQGAAQGLPWHASAISLAVVVVLMLLALANLIDVYGDAPMWAVSAAAATALGALIAYAGTVPRFGPWWQPVMLLAAQFVIGPVIVFNSTTIGHVIPRLSTLMRGWEMTIGAFKHLIAIEPPLGSGGGSLMAVWTIGLWLTFLAGSCAIAIHRWLPGIVPIPVAAAVAVCALLGTGDGWWPATRGIIGIIMLLLWMSWRLGSLQPDRWAASLIIVAVAVTMAVASTVLVPQHRLILRDRYDPPISAHDFTSPLSGMRSYIKNHREDVLLTVRNLPPGTPVRLAVMDRFDGMVWNLSDSSSASGSADYRRVGAAIAADEQGERFTAVFTVHRGLAETWLPVAGAATAIHFGSGNEAGDGRDADAGTEADALYYNVDTDSAIFTAGTYEGLTYTESGVIPRTPAKARIAQANAAAVNQPPAQEVPDAAGTMAVAIAGARPSDGDAALTLADTLRDSGWFSHGLANDFPSDAGHGNHRVATLLTGTAMVGDHEQYASAMALMARELGLPSRVVMGFLPKDEDGSIDGSRTRQVEDTDGSVLPEAAASAQAAEHSTVTEFTGNDVAAWVEIKLEGLGWVAFHPTPKETKLPEDDQNLAPPDPQSLVRQPPVPLTDPLRDKTQPKGHSTLTGTDADPDTTDAADVFWSRLRHIAGIAAVWGSPAWVTLALCSLILAFKALLLFRARRHGTARTRMESGWNAIRLAAEHSGLTLSGTRRDQADAIARRFAGTRPLALRLREAADYASFSGQSIADGQADVYWRDTITLRRAIFASLPKARRMRARLSLRRIRSIMRC